MESIPLRHSISATSQSFITRKKGDHGIPFYGRRFHSSQRRTGLHRFPSIQSKQSDYQDFQDYAKPARLFQTAEAKICKDSSAVENDFSSFKNGVSQSLYKVKLGTSNFSASSLTDLNAGVLLCLIDENGDSLLQRIPASLVKHQSADSDNDLLFPFQRGSVDEFTFIGPKLQRVKAIWIGLESGQWRLGRVSLVVVSSSQPSSNQKGAEDLRYVSVKYEFQAEDILLGEGSNISMLELRPCLATEISGLDPSTLSLPESTSLESQKISNEESMRQYADLKFSLLLYDAMLIFFGTSAASFSVGEHGAFAFLAGGIGGFLYLLLLQRSVDELPAPPPDPSSQNTGETEQMIGGFKGPISTVALAIGFALFVAKYSSGDFPMAFTPKDLIVGMLGFLVCKVAVVLAAFKPLENGLKINKLEVISVSSSSSIKLQKSHMRAELTIMAPTTKQSVVFPELTKPGIPFFDLRLQEVVKRQSQNTHTFHIDDQARRKPGFHPSFLEESYERCRCICEEYAKSFYLGTMLMTEERRKAIWAIYGMRMDTRKFRYQNFQELYLYCYYVAGTVGLMSVPIMGTSPESLISVKRIYDSALYLGIGNQLTNILRDVGEDAMRGRVYLPQDELAQFGLSDKDIFSRKVTERWREFMKEQITRARFYFNLAEEGASQLDKASRWPVWSSLLLYRNILDAIEENDYDNFTKRAYGGVQGHPFIKRQTAEGYRN
ncbi:hypothetical protein G4B88_031417 [Cannabis sativa]|uniref:DUF7755 domain-containing protein n=1 Tax=Cannabis sativa TaxID=3483 RepID=A0A7J6F636_CANSA|nr:hypothetical protein G4B88_031417 [Cannabis sativa]